jgi:hypothetical protein
MLNSKLQGGALFYAIGISVVIAMTVTSLLLCSELNSRLLLRDKIYFSTINNAKSGIYAALDYTETGEYNIDLFGIRRDSVHLNIKPWGVFDLCIAEARTGDSRAVRCALIGNMCAKKDDYAIWLSDLDRPLHVCGNTKIKGNAYLPKSGVERAYIEGTSYTGSELVYGDIHPAQRNLFPIDDQIKERIKQIMQTTPDDSVVTNYLPSDNDTIHGDFSCKSIDFVKNQPIALNNVVLFNNIKIISNSRVTIENCDLRFVQIIAPEIIVQSGNYVGVQFIATDSIHIDSAVTINYPSAILLYSDHSEDLTASVNLEKDVFFSGDIIAIRTHEDYRKQTHINIAADAIIYGRIYSSHSVDFKGMLCGSLTCSTITLQTNSSRYSNHLLNATINNEAMSKDYVSSCFFNRQSEKRGIVQWLD